MRVNGRGFVQVPAVNGPERFVSADMTFGGVRTQITRAARSDDRKALSLRPENGLEHRIPLSKVDKSNRMPNAVDWPILRVLMEELHTDSIDGGHEASYGARSRARDRAYSNMYCCLLSYLEAKD
jgi:hypothetical protein